MVSIKNRSEKIRFVAVGAINTLIDFCLLFGFRWLGVPVVASNIGSTSTAFVFSFFANKNVTFQTKNTNVKREIALFIIVTLFGLWVIQSIVIVFLKPLLTSYSLPDATALFIAKLIATGVTLVWNYILYARVVFIKHP